MEKPNLVGRLGGIAAVLGGGMWSASIFLGVNDRVSIYDGVSGTLSFAIPLLLLLGFVGLYARCRGRFGEWGPLSLMGFVTGLVGVGVASVGLFGAVVQDLGSSWLSELSWWMFAFGYFLLNLGLLFLGNSVLQAGALARLRGLPLAVGVVGACSILIPPWSVPGAVLWVVYGLGWAALGFVLLAEGRSPVRRAASSEPETNV
jgi:hypothetical protein